MQSVKRRSRTDKKRIKRISEWLEDAFAKLIPPEELTPVEYCESIINLGADKTSAAEGLIRVREVTPYLVDPVNYFATPGKCKLTIQAVEQTAKSTSWKLGLAWRLRYRPSSSGIIYQNESVGQKVIRDSFLPMLRCEPLFARAIPERANENPKTLSLPDAPTYLMTGDAAIISIPLGVVVGDEINKWRQEKANRNKKKFSSDEDYQVSKLKDMDKRTRTFPDSLRVLVCSPEGKNAPITTEFKKSSMGFYFLRCAGCGNLTMNTTLPEEYLTYQTEGQTVKRESIRLVCPECGFAHLESEHKLTITRGGGYIHEAPERLSYHAGFCWGALAAQFAGVDWLEICQAIEDAKNSNSYEAQAYLCNSIKGVEFAPAVVTGQKMNVIKSHYIGDLPDGVVFTAVYMAVDTQDNGYWFAVMGIDKQGNWYTLDYGFAWDDDAVIAAWDKSYFGLQPMAGIIDEGGHRKPDVDNLVERLGGGFFKYKGEGGNRRDAFRISDDDELLILAQARRYNAKMLYYIYSQQRKDNHYWYIACEMKRTLVTQLASMQPPPGEPDADFERWLPFDRQHDLFDAHKMCLVIHDFACEHFPDDFFLNR